MNMKETCCAVHVRPLGFFKKIALYLRYRRGEVRTFARLPEQKDSRKKEIWPLALARRIRIRFFPSSGNRQYGVFIPGYWCPVGTVTLQEFAGMPGAEIGYWIGKKFWGRGLATFAVGEVSTQAFKTLMIDKVFAQTSRDNKASQQVLVKCGFHPLATPHNVEVATGAGDEIIIFELLRSDWERLKTER